MTKVTKVRTGDVSKSSDEVNWHLSLPLSVEIGEATSIGVVTVTLGGKMGIGGSDIGGVEGNNSAVRVGDQVLGLPLSEAMVVDSGVGVVTITCVGNMGVGGSKIGMVHGNHGSVRVGDQLGSGAGDQEGGCDQELHGYSEL